MCSRNNIEPTNGDVVSLQNVPEKTLILGIFLVLDWSLVLGVVTTGCGAAMMEDAVVIAGSSKHKHVPILFNLQELSFCCVQLLEAESSWDVQFRDSN